MSITAMKAALEALGYGEMAHLMMNVEGVKHNLRTAIQEAEACVPVAWVGDISEGSQLLLDKPTMWDAIPLYTAPVQAQPAITAIQEQL